MKLQLLFTKGGLQYQILRSRTVQEENSFFVTDETSPDFIAEKLTEILTKPDLREVAVISAMNHFAVAPDSFSSHDYGYDLIALNSNVQRENEELMLSVNKKSGVQFYYTLPKEFYQNIKAKNLPANFNFSGEKFLNSISLKGGKEIHINLYHHQCEFVALNSKKVVLYNNLDVNSEVDFLYFIMFTLSKIGFGLTETKFFVYGETTENETFISELHKFVKNLKIVFDNVPNKNFILS